MRLDLKVLQSPLVADHGQKRVCTGHPEREVDAKGHMCDRPLGGFCQLASVQEVQR